MFDNITALSAPGGRIATDWMSGHSEPAESRIRTPTDHQREQGLEVDDLSELIFSGDRNPVADYLTETGWQPETTTAERMFAVHGRPFRRDDAVAGLLDANYTAAELVA